MLLEIILKIIPGKKLHGNYTILVIRVKPNGTLGSSRPCTNCFNEMIKLGIRKVKYISDDGELTSVKTKSLYGKTTFSKGFKNRNLK